MLGWFLGGVAGGSLKKVEETSGVSRFCVLEISD